MLTKSKLKISGIIKSIIVAGIIEIIGLCIIIAMNHNLQQKYSEIIEDGYNITEEINTIVVNEYNLQNILYNYYSDTNSYEDYQNEIKENIASSNDCINNLNSGSEDSSKKVNELSSTYGLYSSYVSMIISDVSKYPDLRETMASEGNEIVTTCNSLQYDNDNQIRLQAKKIAKYNTILTWMYLIIIFVIISSITICIVLAKKNGKEIIVEQEKTNNKAKKARKESYTDNLTGLWNRKYIESKINQAVKEERTGCLFMIDMDNFKKVNDVYGHIAGDDILKAFANALRKSTRPYDICCRAGGDEFMLFAQDIDKDQVSGLAERIRQNSKIFFAKVEGGKVVTLSMGAQMLEKEMNYEELYNKADNALYIIKENGKDGFLLN